MNKTKVAFFHQSMRVAGPERVMVRLLRHLSRCRLEPALILVHEGGDLLREVPEDVVVHSLGLDEHTKTSVSLLALCRLIRKIRPDVLVSNDPGPNRVACVAKLLTGNRFKLVAIEHRVVSLSEHGNTRFRAARRYVTEILYRLAADCVVCCSAGATKDLLSQFPSLAGRVRVETIPNPTTGLDEVEGLMNERVVETSWFDEETPVFLTVSRLRPEKDHETLIRAFALLRKRVAARLVIIGEGRHDDLAGLCSELGVRSDVQFLPVCLNPFKFMRRAAVFVLCSVYEAMPLVLMEAMACGTPVISTDCPFGPREIIEDGESGLLVPVRDAQALARAMEQLLVTPSLARKLAENGRQRAKAFSPDITARKYERVLTTVLEGRNSD